MPLINCKVSLTLIWSKNCVKTDERLRYADPNANPLALKIRVSKGATLSTQDDNKLLEQLKTGFKRTIK